MRHTSITRLGSLLIAASLVVMMSGCGGGTTASIPPVQAPTPASTATPTPVTTPTASPTATPSTSPTISGFAPTAGPVGTPVIITGRNLATTTAVTFNGTSATFSVISGTQLSATVPTGATTGLISVTTPAGTATTAINFRLTTGPATLDLSINGMYVTQASQDYPNPSVPLVQDRSAWIRVFVVANQNNTAVPDVQVQFITGSATNTLTIPAPSTSVPLLADPNTNASWNASIPAAWIQPGTEIVATVDPSNSVAEADKSNNQASDTPRVITLLPWKVTLIPIQTRDGRTGVLNRNGRTPSDWVDFARRLYPVPDDIDTVTGASMTTSVNTLASDGTGWETVLNELRAKRTADGVRDRYYYGVVNVAYTSGVAGLGYISIPAAIGWDSSGGPSVLAHEEGHNFGRLHSPCGNPDGPDPDYPYSGGLIGVPGWDVFAANGNLKTSNYTDIMGYCGTQWISDYTYLGVMQFRQSNAFGMVSPDLQNDAGEGLLVWGEIENDRVTLEPAFHVPIRGASAIEPGPYVWEARDATGQLLASVNFKAAELADLPGRSLRSFAFVVPLSAEKVSAVSALRILKSDRELARAQALTGPQVFRQGTNPAFVQDMPDHGANISWNAAQYPMVMLRDAKTGEVRGFLRGGNVSVKDAPDEMELHLSNGVNSQAIRHQRTEQ